MIPATGDSVEDAIENISAEALVRRGYLAKKTVYLNEWHGDDKNEGLSPDDAVLTWGCALRIAVREGADAFDIKGTKAYVEQIARSGNDSEIEQAQSGTQRIV
jgi:hypothetical protein